MGDAQAHRRLELVEAALAVALRGVHRDVGVLHQLGRVDGAVVPGNTDARVHDHRHAFEHDRIAERDENTVGDVAHLELVRRVRQQHRELVATEAGRGVVGPHAGVDPRRDLGQQCVAGGVAHRVVHRLEVVEVDEQHRHPPPAFARRLGSRRAPGRGTRRGSRARSSSRDTPGRRALASPPGAGPATCSSASSRTSCRDGSRTSRTAGARPW